MKTRFLSLLCALVLLAASLPTVSALEGEAQRSADTLATLGLMYSSSDYGLEETAARAQATVLLVRLAGAEKTAAGSRFAGFKDTPAWAADAINYAAAQGWVGGITATAFQPYGGLTANAWCTMLLRMLGYSDKAGDFTVSGAPAFAWRIGLLSRTYSGTLTRGQLYETMREALTFCYKGSGETVMERLIARGVCTRASASALGLLDKELTARQAADRHMAAVFCLDLYDSQEAIDEAAPTSNASGFFISADGLAVTNYHSIEGAVHATATLFSGECYDVAQVVYYDKEIDIAVLRISKTSVDGAATSAFAFLELAGTGDIRAGDQVYALGNPLGLGLAVSSGIISATAHDVERYALPCVVNSADISQGSSGGALMNVYGQVIAVTSGAYVYGNNMYLAVPVDPVMTADLSVPGETLAAVAELEAASAETE